MIVYTMTDQEILKELGQELKNDLVKKLDYWVERNFPKKKRSKRLAEKYYGSVNSDFKIYFSGGVALISFPCITVKSTLGNTFVITYTEVLDREGKNLNMQREPTIGYYLKVPGVYKYYPDGNKKAIAREGSHYFKLTFEYDNEHPYRYPKIEFIRITAHFLDRIYQRSKMFSKTMISNELNSIQTLELFIYNFHAITNSADFYDNFLMKFSEDEISHFLSERGFDIEDIDIALELKNEAVKRELADGCLLYIPGIEGKRMPVFKTFLTFEQSSLYDEEMLELRKRNKEKFMTELGLPEG